MCLNLKTFILLLVVAASGCGKQRGQPRTGDEEKVTVTTIAGDGSRDFAEGPALSAKFAQPADVAVGADGTIYVSDLINHRIREIRNGIVSTLAGSSQFGIVDGVGQAAAFKNPYRLSFDAVGNLYCTDENDPRIRKITVAAVVSTYAGLETAGFEDGKADTALFRTGNNIVADNFGNIYVADAGNQRIRKISPDGFVTSFAGTGETGLQNGPGDQARFNQPGGIAIDQMGNLYVADMNNYCIRKIGSGGEVSTFAGSGLPGHADGDAAQAQFSMDMRDLVIDSDGDLYLADDNLIRKITPEGVVTTIAGSRRGFADGDGASALFDFPNGLGVDIQGNVYVADLNNGRIRKISFD